MAAYMMQLQTFSLLRGDGYEQWDSNSDLPCRSRSPYRLQYASAVLDMESKEPRLSIVIPTRNGERVIRDTIDTICRAVLPAPAEIIVVENGSTDGTKTLLKNISDSWNCSKLFVTATSQPGLGHAFSTGVQLSKGAVIYLTADDLPFGLQDLLDGTQQLSEAVMVIGSKSHPSSRVHRSFLRVSMSWVFATLRRLLLGSKIEDSQGTFVLDGKWARNRVALLKESGYLWTAELVDVAEQEQQRIVEIPVHLRQQETPTSSRVRVLDIVDMALGLVRIRLTRKARSKV